MTQVVLPAGFEDLLEFVPDWVHGSERARNAFRVRQPYPALQHFYAVMLPRLDAITAYLDELPLSALPRDAANLLELALMTMEVAPAIEYYQQPDVPNAVAYEKYEILAVPPNYTVVDESSAPA